MDVAGRTSSKQGFDPRFRYESSLTADILLKDGAYDRQLIAHELVHVLQYERFGGIEAFLQAYIPEVIYPPGYPYGLLEQEATRVAASLL